MPINAYTGLMGSGKSFECVSSVIVPAVAAGRTVVTNVDGIDGDAIRAYCHEKFNVPFDQLGTVRHCKNDDVGKADFLPHGIDIDTFCRPGDLVCIDEAWRFWGTDCKLLAEHKVFFREHRHYVDPETKVSCDLVLMVQDISDLHRTLKVVVELTFRTTKIKSLGLSKVYRVEMWEGYKLTARLRSSVANKKYDAEIFPLYSSYDGGKGTELQVDSRQNILKSKALWLLVLAVIVMFCGGAYGIRFFFGGGRHTKANGVPDVPQASQQGDRAANGSSSASLPSNAGKSAPAAFSDVWRVVGLVTVGGGRYVVISDDAGRLRYESPSMFALAGVQLVGTIDGGRVTYYSGSSRRPALQGGVAK
jgi:zona occludens toxin